MNAFKKKTICEYDFKVIFSVIHQCFDNDDDSDEMKTTHELET